MPAWRLARVLGDRPLPASTAGHGTRCLSERQDQALPLHLGCTRRTKRLPQVAARQRRGQVRIGAVAPPPRQTVRVLRCAGAPPPRTGSWQDKADIRSLQQGPPLGAGRVLIRAVIPILSASQRQWSYFFAVFTSYSPIRCCSSIWNYGSMTLSVMCSLLWRSHTFMGNAEMARIKFQTSPAQK